MSTIAFKDQLRGFGISFERSLEDLIKGIRACGGDSEKLGAFFDNSIKECREELKSNDLQLKSTAILKLAYLEMYGFDMSWCNFSILEVMASAKFQHKRIGYLAAIQILQRQNNEDALMLMTNQLKKDLNSVDYLETSLAISGIAAVVSPDLALDLVDDMARMLTHSKPLIRKKAVLCVYKIILAYPESLRQYFDRIVDRLNDDDASVVSATVNVICELAHANAGNYTSLIPTLFGILKMTNDNWIIIRLLKLFAHLSNTEPRLKNKLLPEIIELMKTTVSLSISYECINTILDGGMLSQDDVSTAQLMVERLLVFYESNDLNLRYVGLLALIKVCKIHNDLIKNHAAILLTCIYENDITIRETALDIINSLINDSNIVEIVTRLIVQLIPYSEQIEKLSQINELFKSSNDSQQTKMQGPLVVSDKYKYKIVAKITQICSMKNYENIPNFKWYLKVLIDIVHLNEGNLIEGSAELIGQQLLDISIRVPSIRSKLVAACIDLIGTDKVTDEELKTFQYGLRDCIWIIGEYYLDYANENDSANSDNESDYDSDVEKDDNHLQKYSAPEIFHFISKQDYLKKLAASSLDEIIPTYIHSVAKLYNKYIISLGPDQWNQSQFQEALNFANNLISWLNQFTNASNILTQERSMGYSEILKLVAETLQTSINELGDNSGSPPGFLLFGFGGLFESMENKPLSKASQLKVTIPEDLNFDDDSEDDDGEAQFWEMYNNIVEEQEGNNNLDQNLYAFDSSDGEGDSTQIEQPEDPSTATGDEERNTFDDPYYINNGVKDNMDESSIQNATPIEKPKKTKKPKKVRKERVLVITEDDDQAEDEVKMDVANHKQSQSLAVDPRKLASIDLNQTQEMPVIENEYQVEQPIEAAVNNLSLNTTVPVTNVEPVRHKPKKVRKKKAVIE